MATSPIATPHVSSPLHAFESEPVPGNTTAHPTNASSPPCCRGVLTGLPPRPTLERIAELEGGSYTAPAFDKNVGLPPLRLAISTAVTGGPTVRESRAPIEGSNKELISRSNIRLCCYKAALRNLAGWLEKTGRGTLADILNSPSSAYGNEHVRAWLNLPAHQNPYGSERARQQHRGQQGGAAVTQFRRAFGWGKEDA